MLRGTKQVNPSADTQKRGDIDMIETNYSLKSLWKGNADVGKLRLVHWETVAEAWPGREVGLMRQDGPGTRDQSQ